MKIRKLIVNIFAAAIVVTAAGSCSVMESISTKLPGKASATVSRNKVKAEAKTDSADKLQQEQKATEEQERKVAEKKAAKEKKDAEKRAREQKKKNKKKKKGQTVAPATPAKPTHTSSEKNDQPKPNFTAGTWHLRSVNGYTLSADTDGDDGERPYLIFEEETGRFYGNDGCNTVNGDFIAQGGDSLRFEGLLSTMRLCQDARYAREYVTALDETRQCHIVKNEAESILELRNAKGKVIMTFAKPAMEFLTGSWQVIKIDGHSVDSPDLRLVIDLPERRIHGNTGCNILNGSIFIDPDKAGVIQFQQIAVTQALCHDAQWETALLVALESVETVTPPANANDKTVTMLDTHGKPVLTLRQIQLSDK